MYYTLNKDLIKPFKGGFIYKDQDNYVEGLHVETAEELLNFYIHLFEDKTTEYRELENKTMIIESKKPFKTKDIWMLSIDWEEYYIEITDLSKLNQYFKKPKRNEA